LRERCPLSGPQRSDPTGPRSLLSVDGSSKQKKDGRLRAYSSDDGRIIWDVDTKGEVRTVNGVTAHGGSIDGAGPVVVGGMLFVSSGSGIFGGAPGNVLLAYSVDGR
jgi:PQQ enzyme repeat